MRNVILTVPMWATQPWFPTLLNLLIDLPRMLPNKQNLQRLVHNNSFHPLCKRNFLVTCNISGLVSRVKVFQNTLSNIHTVMEKIYFQAI